MTATLQPSTAKRKNATRPAPALRRRLARRLKKLRKLDAAAEKSIREDVLSHAGCSQDSSSAVDVTSSIQDWIDSLEETPDLVVVPGTGANNEVEALLSLLPDECKLVLLEMNISRAASLFERLDIENRIDEGRLTVAFGNNPRRIELRVMSVLDVPKTPAIEIFGLSKVSPDEWDFYSSSLLAFRNYMRGYMLNIGTLMIRGSLWQENTIRNLPAIIQNPDMNVLDGLFNGRPALVVAAGPSLDDALDHIASVKDKFVIISVGQATRALRTAGIKPDLVVSVDALKVTEQQFETRCDDLYLVSTCLVWTSVMPRFKGFFSGFCTGNPVGRWIKRVCKIDSPPMNAGGTVSATALDLAVRMGCDPVITVGLDLCMGKNNVSHAVNTQYDGHCQDESHLFPVPGNYDESVLTRRDFRVYIDRIAEYVEEHGKTTRFINANNAGAKIEGMELKQLAEIRNFAGDTFQAYEKIQAAHDSFSPPDDIEERFRLEIEEVTEQMADVATKATEAAMICNQLMIMLKMPGPDDEAVARRHLAKLKRIDKRLFAAKESSRLVEMSLLPSFYAMGKKPEEYEKQYSSGVFANMQSRKLYQHTASATSRTRQLLLECFDTNDDNTKEIQL